MDKDKALKLALESLEDGWLLERIDREVVPVLHEALNDPSKEFIGLTDEEIIYEIDQFDWDYDCALPFAKALERKLREKNT